MIDARRLAVPALVLLACTLIASAGVPATDSRAQSGLVPVTVSVDATRTFQPIDGFGVNANARSWNNGQLAPALDMLTDQMGATIFRVILEKSDWQTTQQADPSVYESPKFQNLWGTIGYLNSRNVTVMLNLMGTLPDWLGGGSITPDQEDAWVNMVTSMVSYGRNVRHVQFTLLSPMNEQDMGAPEGPRLSAEQYVRVVDKLTARLAAEGLGDIHIVGPDTASVGAATASYAPAMLADAALMPQVDHFSVHAYSGDTGSMASTLHQSAYGDRDFWVTEWSAWCAGCDRGQPVQAEWQFASTTTDQLFDHLEHGASAAIVYEGYDSYYEHHGAFSYWGQLEFDQTSGTYSPRQRFYTNAQVFRFVLPGMVRIGSDPASGDLRILAFRDPRSGQLAIVGHNSRGADTPVHIDLRGVQLAEPSLHLYQTTQTTSLAQGPDATVQDGAVNLTVAADSFFTLTTQTTLVTPPAPVPPAAPPSTNAAPAATPSSASAAAAPAPVGQVLVGDSRVEPSLDTNAPGTAEAFQMTAAASGTANRLYVYVGPGSTATQVQAGLYADRAGQPGDLLAVGTVSTPNGGTWNPATIPPTPIVAGQRYWLAVLAPSGSLEIADAGESGAPSITSADASMAQLPDHWASGAAWSSSPLSAYATQEP